MTVGDYERPLIISKHVKDLSAGFQILNLKNDILRKRYKWQAKKKIIPLWLKWQDRFDSIKYDVKKIEEVVYDITLRGLHNNASKKRNLADESDQPTTQVKVPKNWIWN